ncbi:hypothetical protein HDU98_002270 [Podochytrium sp. JEL0797]|nr:hypothetical protein HDU98_002270 [Podochytrium sp. JEL0797]
MTVPDLNEEDNNAYQDMPEADGILQYEHEGGISNHEVDDFEDEDGPLFDDFSDVIDANDGEHDLSLMDPLELKEAQDAALVASMTPAFPVDECRPSVQCLHPHLSSPGSPIGPQREPREPSTPRQTANACRIPKKLKRTIRYKIQVVDYYHRNPNHSAVARKFGVQRSQISQWAYKYDALMAAPDKSKFSLHKGRPPVAKEHELLIREDILKSRSLGCKVSINKVMSKFLEAEPRLLGGNRKASGRGSSNQQLLDVGLNRPFKDKVTEARNTFKNVNPNSPYMREVIMTFIGHTWEFGATKFAST